MKILIVKPGKDGKEDVVLAEYPLKDVQVIYKEEPGDEIYVPEDDYCPEEHEEYMGNEDNELYFKM